MARSALKTSATATAVTAMTIAAVVLVILELTARAYYALADPDIDPRFQADAYRGADWAPDYFRDLANSGWAQWEPYVYWRRGPFSSATINIEPDGLRRTWQPPDAGESPMRIFLYGGSAMWGTGARDDYTIASQLARALHAAGTPAEVTNWGESGYVSTQELIALQLELRSGNVPDLVILYDGANDLFASYQHGVAGWPQNEFNRTTEFNLSNPRRLGAILKLSARSLLLNLSLTRAIRSVLYNATGGNSSPTELQAAADPVLLEQSLRSYHGNLALVQALSDAYGFRTLFYWQPTVFGKARLTPYEAAQRQQFKRLQAFFENAPAELNKLNAESADFRVRDLSGVFGNREEPAFIDWVHTGEWANGVVAQAMAADVLADSDPGSATDVDDTGQVR